MTRARKWFILREIPVLDNDAWYSLVAFLDSEIEAAKNSPVEFGEELDEWPSPTWE